MTCSHCQGCVQSQCESGFYGPTCNLPCFPNCRAVLCTNCTCEVCNITSGYCTNGCNNGFYGIKCEHDCPKYCRDLKTKKVNCDKFSGICLNGCKPGFYGNWCNSTCNVGCKDGLCRGHNGTCLKGCKQGYIGALCNSPASRRWDHSDTAGAIGGGFVVILWAAIIVVLIIVYRRRRLKDYAIFRRDTSLGAGSHRGSSRRRLRGHDSVSGAHQEHLLYDGRILESPRVNTHVPLERSKSLNIDTESHIYCACSQTKSCDFLYFPENVECIELEPIEPLENFHVHILRDEYTMKNKRASSEGDVCEMSAVWKPGKY